MATYERLMEAEELIAEVRFRRGESESRIAQALSLSELSSSEIEQEDDLYLCILARYVAALGGHLEVRAVFAEETIAVRREPDDHSQSDAA
ncbi:MAG: transcriptional regulator [Solirubrobacteraceae bacterium]